MSRAFENAGANSPVLTRTGPAWLFGLMGVMMELVLAPVVLAVTFAVGLASYLVLDAPWTRVRSQQRPRFVSVRILYLNVMLVAGFWLAVMFTFSAADPTVSNGVNQRLPALLEVATTSDLHQLITLKHTGSPMIIDPAQASSTWFDVFLHGVVCAVALNFLLYGIVIARRRQRSRRNGPRASRKSLRYEPMVGLFVDEDTSAG